MAHAAVGVGLMYRRGVIFRETVSVARMGTRSTPQSRRRARTPADPPGALPAGRAAHGQRAAPGPGAVRRGLARPGGPVPSPADGHRRAGQRRLGPPDHAHPLRPRPGDAPPPGARARGGWGARATRAGARPGRLAPQRGPLRVPARRTGASNWWRPARPRRARSKVVSHNSVFTIHTPVAARQRAVRRGSRAAASPVPCSTGTAAGHGRRSGSSACWGWARRSRTTPRSST